MKVGSLFAEIGFKVDQSGLEQFSNALKTFQKNIHNGLKELRAYAKAAREISQAMRAAYIPSAQESRARYKAQTRELNASARLKNAKARRTNAEILAGLPALRASTAQQDSKSRFINAVARIWQTSQKERGIAGSHNGKYSQGIIGLLKGIAGFNIGGIAGGIASLSGISTPIVAAITFGVKAIIAALDMVMKTIRDGIRNAMSYRDYMAFTGRSTRGISGLMAASLGTTNMTPEDIMKDVAGLEKQYWDMWFGGGNPRAWQMMGIRPTGNGETDLKNILASVWGATGGFQNRGMARSLLGQFGLSDEYITLIENLSKGSKNFDELFNRTREQIQILEDGNKTMREWDRAWQEVRVELAKTLLDAGIANILKELTSWLRELVLFLRGFDFSGKLGAIFGEKNIFNNPQSVIKDALLKRLGFEKVAQTNNIYSTNNNQVTVSDTEQANDFILKNQYSNLERAWWNRGEYNSSDRVATAVGDT